jgi:hypothetical protein
MMMVGSCPEVWGAEGEGEGEKPGGRSLFPRWKIGVGSVPWWGKLAIGENPRQPRMIHEPTEEGLAAPLSCWYKLLTLTQAAWVS